MTDKNQISKRKTQDLVKIDFASDAGRGIELDQSERIVPFLRLLQSKSPECDIDNVGQEGHIPEAKPGQFINSATNELLDEAIIVPLFRQRKFVERKNRNDGGDIIARHDPSAPVVAKTLSENNRDQQNYLLTQDGNQLVESVYLSALLLSAPNDTEPELICILFQRTKLQAWKQLVQPIDRFNRHYPMFAHRIRLTTSLERRDKGNSYNIVSSPLNAQEGSSLRENVARSVIDNQELYDFAKHSFEYAQGALQSGGARYDEEISDEEIVVNKVVSTEDAPF